MPRFCNKTFKKRKFGANYKDSSASEDLKKGQEQPASMYIKNSSSKSKLGKFNDEYVPFLDSSENLCEIIDIALFSSVLKQHVLCAKCKKQGIDIKFGRQIQGLATELLICCEFCGLIQPLLNTRFTNTVVNKKDTKMYKVNTRLAYAMRSVGKGKAAAKVFCGVMNLPPPPKRFYESLHALNNATEKVAKVSMALAAAETLSFNNGNPNVPVAIDGTWQKRGHTSLNGVVAAVNVDTGKVVDAEILSRKCSCHFNGNLHSDECSANYFGNSGEWKLKAHFVSSIAQRLTDAEIDKLQRYYGLAIRNNSGNLSAMKQAIFAMFFHKISTDLNPQHGLCPVGDDSWCGYNRSKLTGDTYKHKHNLPIAIMHCIKKLNGYVNKQNCCIWSEANPQVYLETPLHPETLTVWYALWALGIIGPYFFKNDEGHNVTVNGDRYRAMITNFFIPELNNHDVQELWFQQDGATCHTARATIDLLKDTFGDRLISRFRPVNWPPRSCDLTPLDYFLWGYVKSLVYADKPQTLDHLEDNIRRIIADIRPQMLEKVLKNWTSRLVYIRASLGSPMREILFKM
ncbi:uncharacterized protein TNCV_3439721 [Trichonephila clavipes]|nr:uncharacterized protein TNCV_3439721 [Trichonephila clavipes]